MMVRLLARASSLPSPFVLPPPPRVPSMSPAAGRQCRTRRGRMSASALYAFCSGSLLLRFPCRRLISLRSDLINSHSSCLTRSSFLPPTPAARPPADRLPLASLSTRSL
jgi:hypothetical protein